MNTAKAIKKLREGVKMNRKEFSEHTGIPVRTLEDYTEDEIALELAGLIEKLLSGIKSDRQFVEEIKKIRKKVICAGGVFSEKK